MTCTFANGLTIPKFAPAVDGSLRTLTTVEVVPSMGAGVDVAVGGWAVWVGGGGVVGGKVAVMMNIVGVAESDATLSPQAEVIIASTAMMNMILCTR